MGVDVQNPKKVNSAEKSVMRKIFYQLSKFMGWLAKGHDGNLPCVG
jgi:ribosomal protein S19E (S16A)